MLDLENAITRKMYKMYKMYGIGGSEIFIEQKVNGMRIDKFEINNFILQLGDVR